MNATYTLLTVIAVLALIAVYTGVTYNSLVKKRVRVDAAWSDITVQLKRRADLIPNLVETVKGYAAHEKAVFEEVTRARAQTLSATNPTEAGLAENQLQKALKSIFAVAEAYPQLQASANFLQMQSELVETENMIQSSRRYYNGGVREFNTQVQSFPSNIVAAIFRFTSRDFFEVDEAEGIKTPPKIEF